jgi:glucokinase
MLLAGDVGGAKTDLAIFSNEAGPHAPLARAEIRGADYPGLQALAREFLTKAPQSIMISLCPQWLFIHMK